MESNENTFLERLENEQAELSAKLNKLSVFISSPAFNNIAPTQRDLLIQQEEAMKQYNHILEDRIKDLTPPILRMYPTREHLVNFITGRADNSAHPTYLQGYADGATQTYNWILKILSKLE